MPEERCRIWELSCFHKDVVLATSFEREELLRLCARHDLSPPSASGIIQHVHMLCHEETPLALEANGILDRRHRHALELIGALGPDEVRDRCLSGPPARLPDLPGLIWAVATDQREGIEALSRAFVHRVVAESVRDAVFGSRELFLLERRCEDLQAELDALRQRLAPPA